MCASYLKFISNLEKKKYLKSSNLKVYINENVLYFEKKLSFKKKL